MKNVETLRYEREQRRAERFALIARIGNMVAANLRLEDLLQNAADIIHERLGYQNVAIPLLLPDDPETLMLRFFGGHYKTFMQDEYRLPVSKGIMGAAVRERLPILVNDVSSDPRHYPTPGAVGITSELAVPILLGGRVLGVLNVESGEPFSEEDAASLQVVADQLAVAIENARLFADRERVAVLEERHRLARELHDSVTQLIFSMTLIAQTLGPVWKRDPAEGELRCKRLVNLSQTALAELRDLLLELRPAAIPLNADTSSPAIVPTLERVRRDGLIAALVALASDACREGLIVIADASGYRPLPQNREEALFRIAQEALNNAVKHSQAERIEIRIRAEGNQTVSLTIADNGVGFLPGKASGTRKGANGMGLTTMRERAEAFGGTVRVLSAPGQGTTIKAILPDKANGKGNER